MSYIEDDLIFQFGLENEEENVYGDFMPEDEDEEEKYRKYHGKDEGVEKRCY